MLAKLLDLPFQAQAAHPVMDALVLLHKLYEDKAVELPPDPEIPLGRAWQRMIASENRSDALIAFEWATLFALRVALRNGSVYVEHSFSFCSLGMLLIPVEDWQRQRNHFYGQLGLPQDPKVFLEPVIRHLDEGLERLREAVERGEVRVDSAVHLDFLKAEPEHKAVEDLRRAPFASRPDGQLPEIILQVDSEVRFSWLLLEREPRSRSELLMVYAAILAHGTSMSAADIARMVPELAAEAIRPMMRRIADERLLRQAADTVLQFMHRHPTTQYWGRADLPSSDMMLLETAITAS
nr:Tn3 family transposase [Paraburkholderia ultramafica]